jgi:hypothetical protein
MIKIRRELQVLAAAKHQDTLIHRIHETNLPEDPGSIPLLKQKIKNLEALAGPNRRFSHFSAGRNRGRAKRVDRITAVIAIFLQPRLPDAGSGNLAASPSPKFIEPAPGGRWDSIPHRRHDVQDGRRH